jgi:hypothetical protein
MTLLSVVRSVCATVGVVTPTSVFSNITANRTMVEMLDLANEMAQRIAYDYRDWTELKTIKLGGLFGGSGAAYPLPANYKRMLLTSNVWRSTNTTTPMRFVPDLDEWLNRRARGLTVSPGEWMIANGQIFVNPPLQTDADESINFPYMDRNCILRETGGLAEEFMSDGDRFRLDERVLKLGMIWQWKAQKGSPYAEDMGTYGDAITNMMGADSPGPILISGRPITDSMQTALPTQTIYVPGMVP